MFYPIILDMRLQLKTFYCSFLFSYNWGTGTSPKNPSQLLNAQVSLVLDTIPSCSIFCRETAQGTFWSLLSKKELIIPIEFTSFYNNLSPLNIRNDSNSSGTLMLLKVYKRQLYLLKVSTHFNTEISRTRKNREPSLISIILFSKNKISLPYF